MRSTDILAALMAAVLAGACSPESPPARRPADSGSFASSPLNDADSGFARKRAGACASMDKMDSAYVVRAAAEAFGPHGPASLEPMSFEPVVAPGPINEGILVRLRPRNRSVIGGGGLAFVEEESGCAIVLRRYE